MSHHTTIIVTTKKNNENITNFHNILKMIINHKELMLKLLFVHKGGFAFGSLQKIFKSCFEYDLNFK
jgi:hypothetical protein